MGNCGFRQTEEGTGRVRGSGGESERGSAGLGGPNRRMAYFVRICCLAASQNTSTANSLPVVQQDLLNPSNIVSTLKSGHLLAEGDARYMALELHPPFPLPLNDFSELNFL